KENFLNCSFQNRSGNSSKRISGFLHHKTDPEIFLYKISGFVLQGTILKILFTEFLELYKKSKSII
ncbi:MAG: hypothetical protein KKH98_07210, partial [Spirochaetes bacterium]|nr:hypothetical protein [Spirochaetota bacterium]